MPPRQQFFEVDGSGLLLELFDVGDGLVDFFLAPAGVGCAALAVGHDAGDAAAAPGDYDRLTVLNVVEQSAEMGLGLGGSDLTRHGGGSRYSALREQTTTKNEPGEGLSGQRARRMMTSRERRRAHGRGGNIGGWRYRRAPDGAARQGRGRSCPAAPRP